MVVAPVQYNQLKHTKSESDFSVRQFVHQVYQISYNLYLSFSARPHLEQQQAQFFYKVQQDILTPLFYFYTHKYYLYVTLITHESLKQYFYVIFIASFRLSSVTPLAV